MLVKSNSFGISQLSHDFLTIAKHMTSLTVRIRILTNCVQFVNGMNSRLRDSIRTNSN
jgi:hypothetical protein